MKKTLSGLPAPVLAGVVKENTKETAIAEITNCVYDGAKMIDLHMSELKNTDVETLRAIVEASKLPILALNYGPYRSPETAEEDEEERIGTFLRAIEAHAAGIDMQGYTGSTRSRDGYCGKAAYSFTGGNPKEIVTDEAVISKQCDLIERAHSAGVEVLLSTHPGIPMKAEQLVDLALFLEKRNPDIIKIVTIANNQDDLLESFRSMALLKKEIKTPVAYHASGKAGMLSRIVNPALGGHIMFCVDRYKQNSALEQIDLRTAKTLVESLKEIM